ncbi:hypothetical protein Scep_006840 [Stephania cephalantha]|uniref:Uncharacterized protein n=1 Tax=Stephania cephalantha TaxID=152367 RepID=A0AAP0KAF8_9MAGN
MVISSVQASNKDLLIRCASGDMPRDVCQRGTRVESDVVKATSTALNPLDTIGVLEPQFEKILKGSIDLTGCSVVIPKMSHDKWWMFTQRIQIHREATRANDLGGLRSKFNIDVAFNRINGVGGIEVLIYSDMCSDSGYIRFAGELLVIPSPYTRIRLHNPHVDRYEVLSMDPNVIELSTLNNLRAVFSPYPKNTIHRTPMLVIM